MPLCVFPLIFTFSLFAPPVYSFPESLPLIPLLPLPQLDNTILPVFYYRGSYCLKNVDKDVGNDFLYESFPIRVFFFQEYLRTQYSNISIPASHRQVSLTIPAPTCDEGEVYLHLLTYKEDNTCTPTGVPFKLRNGYITLQAAHFSG